MVLNKAGGRVGWVGLARGAGLRGSIEARSVDVRDGAAVAAAA